MNIRSLFRDKYLENIAISNAHKISNIEELLRNVNSAVIENDARGTTVIIISEIDDGVVRILHGVPVENVEQLNELISVISKNYFVKEDNIVKDKSGFKRFSVPQKTKANEEDS